MMTGIHSVKQFLKRTMVCIHIVLILMPVICALNVSVTERDDAALLIMTICSAILIFPTVLSRISERHIGSLIVNLLVSAVLIAGTGALAWYLGGLLLGRDLRIEFAIVIGILSLICVRGSVSRRLVKAAREKAQKQHDISWQEPRIFLESPSVRLLIWYGILYVLGLLFACPVLCDVALCTGALYLVLALLYERLDGTEGFIKEVQDVSHVPFRRIRRIGDAAVLLFSLLCLAFAGIAALLSRFRRYTDLRELRVTIPWHLLEYGASPKANDMEPELLREIARIREGSGKPLPWLEPLAYIVAGIILVLFIRLLLKEFLNTSALFREGFDENGDLIISLRPEEEARRLKRKKRRERPRTEEDRVRREYRTRIEKQLPGGPEASDTPEEIERRAGIEDADLHRRYEKARYDGQRSTFK